MKLKKYKLKNQSLITSSKDMLKQLDEAVSPEEDGAFEMNDLIPTPTFHRNSYNTTLSGETSSTSSSEEDLLNCHGALLNKPIVPNALCTNRTRNEKNLIQYSVKEDGYYYFIFSSNNEKVI